MVYSKYTLELIEQYIAQGMDVREARERGHHFEKTLRRIEKRDAKRKLYSAVDRLAHPLTEEKRIHGDWDSWTEYGFFDGTNYTDDEVREMLDGIRIRPRYSAYDCTGEAFTMWVTWHRNPSGLISYTHRIGLDV